MTAIAFAAATLVGAGLVLLVLGLAPRKKTPPLPDDLGYRPPSEGEKKDTTSRLARLAEGGLGRNRVARKLTVELPRAGLRASPAEFLMLVGLSSAALGLLAALLAGPIAGFLAGIAGVVGARIWVRRKARKWADRFDEELPEALDLLAGSLQAGSSLAQAMELVAAEGQPPLSEEFDRVLGDTRLGESLVDALESSAERVGSLDYAWTIRAVRVQQEFGASLSDLMRTLAEFMRWRQELRREVRALTAEGRISAYVLIGLPFAVAGLFALVNPEYLGALISTPLGWIMTGIAAVLMTVGSIWMTRIVKVEV